MLYLYNGLTWLWFVDGSGWDIERGDYGERVTKGGDGFKEEVAEATGEEREKEREKANRAKKAQAKGATSTTKGIEGCANEKWHRQDDDGGLAELDKRRRGLETSIHDIKGGTVQPPFDLNPPSRLPLGMEELFPEGINETDFVAVRGQKKEVTLAMWFLLTATSKLSWFLTITKSFVDKKKKWCCGFPWKKKSFMLCLNLVFKFM